MKKTKEIEISPLFNEILNETPLEDKLYISKSLEIANQIVSIMERKNMMQKDLATKLGKSEAEISKWLSGFHNFTIKTITKIEAELKEDIILTPKHVSKKLNEAYDNIISKLNNEISIRRKVNYITTTAVMKTVTATHQSAKIIQFKPSQTERPKTKDNLLLTGTYS